MGRPKGAKNVSNVRHLKCDNPFSYEFADKTRYDAFKALFEAIEQEVPAMVEDLQKIAEIGTNEDWHWLITWYVRMSMEENVWKALTRAVEDYETHEGDYKKPLTEIRDGLMEWSKKYYIERNEWSFLRESALLAIMAYHEGKETLDEPPTLTLSQNCHFNTEIDTGNKLILYMHDKQRDGVHLFELIHPFVFAPPSPSGINGMPDLPKNLQKEGFAIPIEPHPAENLLYRERTLIFASTSGQDPRANELSTWFYWEVPTSRRKILNIYRGMAYDPREGKEDWNSFETRIRNQFEEYLKDYKQATDKWLAQQEYDETQTLSPNKLKEFSTWIVYYFILEDKKEYFDAVKRSNGEAGSINIDRAVKEFFTRGLGIANIPQKKRGRPKTREE